MTKIVSLVRLSNDTAEFLIAELIDMIENSSPETIGTKERNELFQLSEALSNFDAVRLDIEPPEMPDLAA